MLKTKFSPETPKIKLPNDTEDIRILQNHTRRNHIVQKNADEVVLTILKYNRQDPTNFKTKARQNFSIWARDTNGNAIQIFMMPWFMIENFEIARTLPL